MSTRLRISALRRAFRVTAGPATGAIIAASVAQTSPSLWVAGLGVAIGAAAGAAATAALGVGLTDPRLARRLLRRWRRRRRPAPPRAEPVDELAVAADLLDSLPLALALLDVHGEVVFANAAMKTELERDPTGELFASSHRAPPLIDAVRRALETGEGAEATFAARRTQLRRMFAMIRPIRRSDPGTAEPGDAAPAAALMVVLIDETRARIAERVHRDFVANASHELKTPLASIAGFLETLRGPARDDPQARERFLEIMADQAARMGRLVEDLLALNRIELNEHQPPRDIVDLGAAIEDAVAASEVVGGVDLRVSGPLPMVIGDRAELTQVFANLIDNAVKYGGGPRPPQISAERAAAPGAEPPISAPSPDASPPSAAAPSSEAGGAARAMVAVTVQDFGPGIAKQHIPRLTERFYRVSEAAAPASAPTGVRRAAGTGLGLAIVKHIISRHRGELRIESRLGRGSRFTVWLPCASPSAPADVAVDASARTAAQASEDIAR